MSMGVYFSLCSIFCKILSAVASSFMGVICFLISCRPGERVLTITLLGLRSGEGDLTGLVWAVFSASFTRDLDDF